MSFYSRSQKIGSAFRTFWHFRPNRFYLLFFALSQAVAWWQAGFIFRHLTSNFLVLHYNINFGIDSVGVPAQIFLFPLYCLGVLLVNLFIAVAMYRQKNFRTFSHLLLASALFFAVILNLVLFFVYLINFK